MEIRRLRRKQLEEPIILYLKNKIDFEKKDICKGNSKNRMHTLYSLKNSKIQAFEHEKLLILITEKIYTALSLTCSSVC